MTHFLVLVGGLLVVARNVFLSTILCPALFYPLYLPLILSELRSACCYCSVAKSCLTLYDPIDCSTPGFSVLHCLLERAQVYANWAGDQFRCHLFLDILLGLQASLLSLLSAPAAPWVYSHSSTLALCSYTWVFSCCFTLCNFKPLLAGTTFLSP